MPINTPTKARARRAWPMLCAGGSVLSVLGGYWLCACCPLPEALYLSLLAADYSPVFLTGRVWLLALWLVLLVACVGLGLLAVAEIVGAANHLWTGTPSARTNGLPR